MLPWHIPLEGAPCLKSKTPSPQPTLLKHYCTVNVHENPCEELQTGILCDIGMVNKDPLSVQRLIAAGMTIARLDLRDLEPESCFELVQSVRQAVYNYSTELEFVYPLAVVVDVKGPDIYIGNLKGGNRATIDITEGSTIRLTNDILWLDSGTHECLYFKYEEVSQLHSEDVIWIDTLSSGKIKLVVVEVGPDFVDCKCIFGGKVGAKMAVRISHIPREETGTKAGAESESTLSCNTSSTIDFDQIDQQVTWAIGADVDGVFVPNTQNVHDIVSIRMLLGDKGKHILIFACIDSVLGFDNIDKILTEADGIYVDRSVLSIDLPVEKIFIAQKVIISKCNMVGKPCVSRAVINEQIPTLCVSDIANLTLDGVDVLALDLYGDSPLKSIAASNALRVAEHCLIAAAVICRQAERVVWQPQIYGNLELMQRTLEEPTKAICVSAVELAMRSKAVVMICLTNSGRTAKIVSQVRPPCPVIAVTRACHVARQLRFWRGIRAVHYFEIPKEQWPSEVEARIRCALDYSKAKRILRAGDPYVILTSTRRGVGYCDAVRLLYASARDTVTVENLEI